jgi:hypothetical protein
MLDSEVVAPPFLISVLDGIERSASVSGGFNPPYAFDRRLLGPQIRSGLCEVEKHFYKPKLI